MRPVGAFNGVDFCIQTGQMRPVAYCLCGLWRLQWPGWNWRGFLSAVGGLVMVLLPGRLLDVLAMVEAICSLLARSMWSCAMWTDGADAVWRLLAVRSWCLQWLRWGRRGLLPALGGLVMVPLPGRLLDALAMVEVICGLLAH